MPRAGPRSARQSFRPAYAPAIGRLCVAAQPAVNSNPQLQEEQKVDNVLIARPARLNPQISGTVGMAVTDIRTALGRGSRAACDAGYGTRNGAGNLHQYKISGVQGGTIPASVPVNLDAWRRRRLAARDVQETAA